jgi:N6-adenosine-specific RNA methylase IME4
MFDQSQAHVFRTGPFIGLPVGHYCAALIDPPWSFRTWSARGKGKSADRHYACQSLDDIISLPIDALMATDAVLFLWVIQSHFPQALRALEAWGFTYKTVAFVWVKPRLGMGFHTRAQSEQCWLATRGKGYQRQSKSVRQVVFAAVREHSRKPDAVAHRIDQLVGNIPRIELFGRSEQRPGWTVWGDEVGKFNEAHHATRPR